MRILLNLVAGVIFGLGLIMSGMANPEKVLNFLDFAGTWDPSLAFVMAGAIAVTTIGYWLARQRSAPLLEDVFQIPPTRPITVPLIAGSALFGLGWGLSGFCPGPAIVALALSAPGTLVFVPAMLAGIAGGVALQRWRLPVMHALT